jgi:hypothetical protein
MRKQFYWLSLLTSTSARLTSELSPGSHQGLVNQDRFVDFEYCFHALGSHDTDGNLWLDQNEFLDFVQDFGGKTECLGSLDDELSLGLRVVWNQLSCECRHRGGVPDCCLGMNALIPIVNVSEDDQSFLRQICLRIDQAILTFCSAGQSDPSHDLSPGHEPEEAEFEAGGASSQIFEAHTKAFLIGIPSLLLFGLLVVVRFRGGSGRTRRYLEKNNGSVASSCFSEDEDDSSMSGGDDPRLQCIRKHGSTTKRWDFGLLANQMKFNKEEGDPFLKMDLSVPQIPRLFRRRPPRSCPEQTPKNAPFSR